MLYLDIDAFFDAASAFYKLTKTQVSIYDENFQFMAAYPGQICDFCRIIRDNQKLEKKCLDCDKLGLSKSKETKQTYTYHCHMGLTEMITPILCDDKIIGYIILGQIIDETNIELVKQCVKKIKNQYNIDYEKLEEALISHPKNENEFIINATKLLEMSSSYFWTNNIISIRSDSFIYQIKNYIGNNLNSDLSVDELCRKFNLSPTSLYRISSTYLHMGISRYIAKERIYAAKKLLTETNKSIYEICEQCGISDVTYLTKLFKKEFGVTPRKYKSDVYKRNN